MSLPYAKPTNIANEWVETDTDYARRENPKGYVVDATDSTGKLIYYQKKINDISGRNNHMFIGPSRIDHTTILDSKWAGTKIYYGTVNPGTLYNSNNPINSEGNDVTVATKTTFILYDNTKGTKWWRSDRWHKNQLYYYNSENQTYEYPYNSGIMYSGGGTPFQKGHVQIDSYTDDPVTYINLKNTTQHYANSTSIVTQFSDAHLYDFTLTSTKAKTIQKRIGFWETFYVSYNTGSQSIYMGGFATKKLGTKPDDANNNPLCWDMNNEYWYKEENNKKWFETGYTTPTEIIVGTEYNDWYLNDLTGYGNPYGGGERYAPGQLYSSVDNNTEEPNHNAQYYNWTLYTWQNYTFSFDDATSYQLHPGPWIFEFSFTPNGSAITNGVTYYIDDVVRTHSQFESEFGMSSHSSSYVNIDPDILYNDINCVTSNGTEHAWAESGQKYIYYQVRVRNSPTIIGNLPDQSQTRNDNKPNMGPKYGFFKLNPNMPFNRSKELSKGIFFNTHGGRFAHPLTKNGFQGVKTIYAVYDIWRFNMRSMSSRDNNNTNLYGRNQYMNLLDFRTRINQPDRFTFHDLELNFYTGIPYLEEQPYSVKYSPVSQDNSGTILTWGQAGMRLTSWSMGGSNYSNLMPAALNPSGNLRPRDYFEKAVHLALGIGRVVNGSFQYGYWSNILTKDGTWTNRGANSATFGNASTFDLGDTQQEIRELYQSVNPNWWLSDSAVKSRAGARIRLRGSNVTSSKVGNIEDFMIGCRNLTINDVHQAMKTIRDGITDFQVFHFGINENDHTDLSGLNPGYKYSLSELSHLDTTSQQYFMKQYVTSSPWGPLGSGGQSVSEFSTNGPDPFFVFKLEVTGGTADSFWNDGSGANEYKLLGEIQNWSNIENTQNNQLNHRLLLSNAILNFISTYYDDANYWNISDNVSVKTSSEYNNGNTFGQHMIEELVSKSYPNYVRMYDAFDHYEYLNYGGVWNNTNPPMKFWFHRYGIIPSFNEVDGHGPGLKWQFYPNTEGFVKADWKHRYFDTTPLGSNSAVEQEWDYVCDNFPVHGSDTSRISWSRYFAMGKEFLAIDDVNTKQTLRYGFEIFNNGTGEKWKLWLVAAWKGEGNGYTQETLNYTQGFVTCFVGQPVAIFTQNSSDPHILLSSTSDGTHNGGTIYNTGVVYISGGNPTYDANGIPSGTIQTESEYMADTTSQYRYIIFTPSTVGDFYYYSHENPSQGGIVRVQVQRPYYYVRNERDKYWNFSSTPTFTEGQIPSGLSMSGVPRNVFSMQNWRQFGEIHSSYYKKDPRHPLMNVMYVYQPVPSENSSYGGYSSNIFIIYGPDGIYNTEVNGFRSTDSGKTFYTGEKYTIKFPSKCPGNANNVTDGYAFNGENNRMNANNFKIMLDPKYETSNVSGVTDGKGWNNTNWYVGASDGWNIINSKTIEFTPNDNLAISWDYNNGNETTTPAEYGTYKMFNITDTIVSSTGNITVRRKYVLNKDYSNESIYNFMNKVISLKSSTSSKQEMITRFTSEIIPLMDNWLGTLPTTKSKTVPSSLGNQTFPAEETRWYHTGMKDDRIVLQYNYGKQNIKISDYQHGSSSGQERYNLFYNSHHRDPSAPGNVTQINEKGGVDQVNGGKLILVWYYKSGTVPNHFNICGDIQYDKKTGQVLFENSQSLWCGCGVNEVIAFDEVHSEENINTYIKYLNKKWQVYRTDSSTRTVNFNDISYINYNGAGSFIPSNVVTAQPTVGIGNKLFHFNGDAKNIAGASNIVPSAGSLVQTDTNLVIFDSSVINYKLIIPNQDYVNFTVTNADATQSPSTITGNTGFVVGVDKTVTITTISESRLSSIIYTIVVTRRSPAQEADLAAESAFGSAGNDPNHPVNFLKDINNTGGVSETIPLGTNLQNFLKNNITGNNSEKRQKRKAQFQILLANFSVKKIKISRDTLASPIIPANITSVSVFKPSLVDKPDLSSIPAGEAVYVPLSDNQETALVVNGSTITVKCTTATGDGNFTLTLPSQEYVNTTDIKVNNIAVTSVSQSNLNYDDVLIIDGKTIIIGSVTYTGNAGTLRVNEYNQFNDTSSHQNDLIQIGNNFFQINLNPSSYQNFWENPTFWSNTNFTNYNNDCNITYDNKDSVFEYYVSSIDTANLLIKGASDITTIYNNQNTSIIANTLQEELGASTHLFKNNRILPIDGNNSETHNNLSRISNTKNIIHHNTFNKITNHQNKTFEKNCLIISNINKTLTVHNNKDTFKYNTDNITISANSSITTRNYTNNTTYQVTSESGKYYFDGSINTENININIGTTISLNLDDSSNDTHPLGISTTVNGTQNGGTVYTTNVTYQLDGVSKTWNDYTSQFSTATTRRIIFTPTSNDAGTILHYFCPNHQNMGSGINGSTDNAKITIIDPTTYQVTAQGGKYYFNGSINTENININIGITISLNLDDSSNDTHPLGISTTVNGTQNGGTVYTTNVTYQLDGVSKTWNDYTSQFSTATTRRIIFTPTSNDAGTILHYFCPNHQNMGSGINGSTDYAKITIATLSYLKNKFNTHSITINGNKKSNMDSQNTNIHGNFELKDTNNFETNIYDNLNKTYDNNTTHIYKDNSTISSENKSLTISGNKTLSVNNNSSKFSFNQNIHITNNLTQQYKSNHTLNNYGYKKSFYNCNISLSHKNNYNLNIYNNNTINIHGFSKLNYNNTISTIDNNNIKFNHNLNKTIHNTQQTFTSNQTINIHHYNVNVVGNYKTNMQNKYNISTTDPIKISSTGGLQISSNLNHSLQLNSNVGISDSSIISNVPYNLTTDILSSYINDSGTESSMFVIDPVYSFILITLDTNNTIAQSHMTKDLYIRFNLKPGKYNGQQIKIALHPIYQKFFDSVNDSNYNSINKRLNYNLNTDIIIRIDSLCDVNTNEFVTADLILNKGGMCLNLLYVDINDNNPIASSNNINHYRNSGITTTGTGYWMLIGNSFSS